MKKVIIVALTSAALAFSLMSFSPGKSVNETSLGASSLFLNPPSPIGQVRIGTDGESYLNFGLSRLHQADGYEWTVTNANIISGNGTRSISVVPACLSTVTASVRAYNLNPDGTRCYTVPVTTSYYWTGDCLFNGIN